MKFKLVVCFVNPDQTEKAVAAAKSCGATGDVILNGKGSGIEPSTFLGMSIEDRTNIILFVVEDHCVNSVIDGLKEACDLETPGNGIVIALSIDKVAGLDKQIKRIRQNLSTEQL